MIYKCGQPPHSRPNGNVTMGETAHFGIQWSAYPVAPRTETSKQRRGVYNLFTNHLIFVISNIFCFWPRVLSPRFQPCPPPHKRQLSMVWMNVYAQNITRVQTYLSDTALSRWSESKTLCLLCKIRTSGCPLISFAFSYRRSKERSRGMCENPYWVQSKSACNKP